jgi:hypothetical protein
MERVRKAFLRNYASQCGGKKKKRKRKEAEAFGILKSGA